MIVEQNLKVKMFLLGGVLLVTVILREARSSRRFLLTLFEDVLCQSTWSEPQAVDVAVHAA